MSKISFQLSYYEIDAVYSVISILQECGAKRVVDKGSYLSFSSPFREDKNPSMVLYKNTLACVDFAGDFSGSLYGLVKVCLGISLYKLIGTSTSQIMENRFFNGFKLAIKGQDGFAKVESLEDFKMFVYEGSIEYDFSKNEEARNYLKSRFIDEDYMKEFAIGYTEHCKIYRAPKRNTGLKGNVFNRRVCIPIYYKGNLLSIEGRDYTRKQEKKVIYPFGGTTSYLFNYDNLKKDEPLIVVEGIMDTVRIWKHITKNVTTTFGINITGQQRELLKDFSHVIIFSDSDSAGRKMIGKFDDFYENNFWIARLKEGDPGDSSNSIQDLERAINEAKESTEFLLDESELFTETSLDKDFFTF